MMEAEISQFVSEQRDYTALERSAQERSALERSERERYRDRDSRVRRRERRRRQRERDHPNDRRSESERDRHGWDSDEHSHWDREERERSHERSRRRSYEPLTNFYEEGGYRDVRSCLQDAVIKMPNSPEQRETSEFGENYHYAEGTYEGSSRGSDDGYVGSNHARDRDRDSRDLDRGGEKWMTETPTNTILLRGLPQHIDEKDIKAELMLFGLPIKEVRLMKRSTGISRGFAFVEFQSVTDSQRWMEHNQGRLVLLNQYHVRMYYSTPRKGAIDPAAAGGVGPGSLQDWRQSDWSCSKCGYLNFKRRDRCLKCNTTKEESDRAKDGDGFEHVGNNPCNTLIFRGLDALTTEETLVTAISKISALVLKNTKVIRDDLTGTSRGYAFAEMSSIQDSTNLLTTVQNLQQPFDVDGKAIIVSYAKNTFSTVMATMNQQWSQPGTWDYSQYPGYDNGYYYDQNGQYYGTQYDYAQYYGLAAGTATTATPGGPQQTQTDSTNAAAAVAQAAIQQAQAAKHFQKQHEEMQKQILDKIQQQQNLENLTQEERLAHEAAEWSQQKGDDEPHPRKGRGAAAAAAAAARAAAAAAAAAAAKQQTAQPAAKDPAKYPVPDVSTYQFDETSGYYFDPATGLYYDANSQYYYNSQSSQFLYWDGEKQSYLPAPTDAMDGKLFKPEDSERSGRRERPDRKEKVKIAKKIAKDMEKWAKSLNAQKEAVKGFSPKTFQPLGGMPRGQRESATADAGFAVLEKAKHGGAEPGKNSDQQLMPPPPAPANSSPANGSDGSAADAPLLVASYGGDSDSDDDVEGGTVVDEEKLVDWSKMACLLCKRMFPSKEGLQRHMQMSDLHKKNLEELKKSKGPPANDSVAAALQYRDRAKERRQKYGMPQPPQPAKRKEAPAPVPFEQPTKTGIGNENKGNQMLQKMGWSQGQGLGRQGQGIVDPIESKRRQAQAGLGAKGSTLIDNLEPGDTYKDCVKKTMFARYHDVE